MSERDELAEALAEAVEILHDLGRPIEDVLGEDRVTVADQTPTVAHALGVIEGAAVALGVTAIEVLDEYNLLS